MFFWIARQARSSDAAVRRRAAAKLGAGGRPAAPDGPLPRHVALLLNLLTDADAGVRAAAYESLGRVADGRASEAMAAGVDEIDKLGEPAAAPVREAAANAFGAMGEVAVPALVQLARSRNAKAREVAVTSLGRIGGADAEHALVTALQDNRSSVRQLAIQSLARNAATGSVRSLSAALEHRDPATRRSAIEAMGMVKGADAPRVLARLTADPDRAVREAAVRALGKQGSPEAIEALLGVVQAPERELRQLAIASLKELQWHPSTAGQRALRAIIDGNYRAAAAQGGAAVDPLAALLTDRSPVVRSAIAQALGETADAQAVTPLLIAVQDSDASVRQAAVDALVSLGAPAVGPLARSVHEAARAAAADVVLRIGAPAAVPLLDLLQRGEPYERDGVGVRRLGGDDEVEHCTTAAKLLARLLGRAAGAVDRAALHRAARLCDIVIVREIVPTNRRESARTVVDLVVDCQDLRDRATAELHHRGK